MSLKMKFAALVAAIGMMVPMVGAIAIVPAHASDVEHCFYGSGAESNRQFCAVGNMSAGGYMQIRTILDRITCTVTVWQYYWPTATWLTYAQAHQVGGVRGPTIYGYVNGDSNPSHYLIYGAWQRCDNSYVYSGYYAFSG